ncbi:MAG TPA: hypothetical protein VH678_25555 [Xanthobacteraceae bacterium]|jgi:hypothetical protein
MKALTIAAVIVALALATEPAIALTQHTATQTSGGCMALDSDANAQTVCGWTIVADDGP